MCSILDNKRTTEKLFKLLIYRGVRVMDFGWRRYTKNNKKIYTGRYSKERKKNMKQEQHHVPPPKGARESVRELTKHAQHDDRWGGSAGGK